MKLSKTQRHDNHSLPSGSHVKITWAGSLGCSFSTYGKVLTYCGGDDDDHRGLAASSKASKLLIHENNLPTVPQSNGLSSIVVPPQMATLDEMSHVWRNLGMLTAKEAPGRTASQHLSFCWLLGWVIPDSLDEIKHKQQPVQGWPSTCIRLLTSGGSKWLWRKTLIP